MVAVVRFSMDHDLMRTGRLTQEFSASLPYVASQRRTTVSRRNPMPPKGVGFPDPPIGDPKIAGLSLKMTHLPVGL
jgi:hypothetical protein